MVVFRRPTTISSTNLLSLHFHLEHRGEFTRQLAGESKVCVYPLRFLFISFISFDFFWFLLISSDFGCRSCLLGCSTSLPTLSFRALRRVYKSACGWERDLCVPLRFLFISFHFFWFLLISSDFRVQVLFAGLQQLERRPPNLRTQVFPVFSTLC